jgi:4a-hydroxytetrahydrobiopterin dehydratase
MAKASRAAKSGSKVVGEVAHVSLPAVGEPGMAQPEQVKMSEAEVEVALKATPEWSHIGEVIQRTFQFGDFVAAMRFVNAVAVEAERVQHHPDIMVRYNKVTLSLATHDAGGITSKDFALAAQADAMAVKKPA